MFSTTCEYAIRAVIFLAGHSADGKKLGIREIAEAIGSPMHFTAKILQNLAKKNVIASVKGPNGGFYLENPQEPLPVINIVYAIEGEDAYSKCGLGLKQCSDKHPCPLHFDLKASRDGLKELLKRKSVQQLATETITNNLRLNN